MKLLHLRLAVVIKLKRQIDYYGVVSASFVSRLRAKTKVNWAVTNINLCNFVRFKFKAKANPGDADVKPLEPVSGDRKRLEGKRWTPVEKSTA